MLELGIQELRERLNRKELSAGDLVEESLRRIAQVDERIKAFLTLDQDGARRRASELDRLDGGAAKGLLFGLPAAIKDNIVTKGMRTTCASRMLEQFTPIYDATVVEKLHGAQAITIGKTNLDEFAMGSSNETSAFYPTRNPWNPDYVPGGSSGGSAAAVAAGEVVFALGTDTGGSIRQPAAYCGVVGLKPTYGLVSRFGAVAFASSLDQIGPITRTVKDAAFVLQAIAGYDPQDSTSARVDIPDYIGALTGDIKGLRIAVPADVFRAGVDPSVEAAVRNALKVFESLGAHWEEVEMPHHEYAVAAYYLIACSEASSNLARFDGIRFGYRSPNAETLHDVYVKSRSKAFGPEVKRRIMLGTYALSSGYYDAYYLKAQKVRTLIKRDYDQVFQSFDIILGPTTPTPAFRFGEKIDDPLTMYLNDIFSIPANLAGIPAISIPCGLSEGGLPIGLQLAGKAFDEATVLRAAHAFEQATEYHKMRPPITDGRGEGGTA